MASFTLHSELDTSRFAEGVASAVQGGQALGLIGELGAGKTTFVRHLLRALGDTLDQVSSPSYSLQNEYCLPSGLKVEHWDLYRLRSIEGELLEAPAPDVIRIVEWPDVIPGFTDSLDLQILLEVAESGARIATLAGPRLSWFNEVIIRYVS